MISSALQDAIGAALLPWVFLTGSMRESGAAYMGTTPPRPDGPAVNRTTVVGTRPRHLAALTAAGGRPQDALEVV